MRGGMKLNLLNQSGIGNLWVVVIAAVAFAAGAGGMYVATSGLLADEDQSHFQPIKTDNQEREAEKEPEETDIEFYQMARNGKTSLECQYTKDGRQSTAYLRANGHFRLKEKTEGRTQNLIKKGDQAYLWAEGSNQGYRYNTETYNQQLGDEYDVFEEKQFKQRAQADTIDCQSAASLDDGLFTRPDINYTMPTDQS